MFKQANGNSLESRATRFATPSESVSSEDGRIIIGKGTRITGTVADCHLLDVHGVLEADVVTDQLIVRNGGGVRGMIQTSNAEIHGVVEGQISVHDHVNIHSTAQIAADLTYKTMELAAGGYFSGNVKVHSKIHAPEIEKVSSADVIQMNGVEHTGTLNDSERTPCAIKVQANSPVMTRLQ